MGTGTDPEGWKRARAIFDAVVDLPAPERPARLAALCEGDAALRADVESLLAHDHTSRDPISSIIGQAAEAVTGGAPSVHAGQTLLHYSVTEKIGEGGMGVVWKALDHSLGRDVAIKVLPSEVAKDPGRLARFEREAKVLASLNHTNIAAVYSLHEAAGVRFLAMEYVEGDDLARRIAKGPLPLPQAIAIARQVADGLEEAHEKGIVHRDLKPANVKVTPSGKAKVLDFGLAKAFGSDIVNAVPDATPDRASLSALATRAGLILGTAAYMAPEQARGLPVDKRADIWAFGVLLFEMISGTRPFAGATLTDVLAAVVSAEPDWGQLPAATPPTVVRLIRRCLEKDVRQRLRDIGDARIDLEALGSGSGSDSGVRSAVVGTRAARAARRRRREVGMFLLGGAATALAAWILTGRGTPPEPGVQRLTASLAPGTRLEDVLDFSRQTLALSRDGTRLAFVVRDGAGRKQIHVRRIAAVDAEPVSGTEGGDMPFFSPDGGTIGFAADGKLKRVAVTGGQATIICDAPEPRGASWGDDGTIVFAPGVFTALARVPASGGTPTPITTLAPGAEESHRWPVILPGGRAVVFNADPRNNAARDRTAEILRLDTGERRTLVRAAVYPHYVDGHLLYGEAGRLLAAPFDLVRLALTGPAAPVLDDVRMDATRTGIAAFDVAPSGALVYVPGAERPAERSLVWLDRRGAARPAAAERRSFLGARLSPDGRRVAVVIDGSPKSLWTFDLSREAWTRISFDEPAATPAWMPDGARILYASADPHALFLVSADGGSKPLRVTPPAVDAGDMPTIAPDGGTALMCVQDSRGDDIVSVTLDGRAVITPFQADAANETSPAISPSGRFVAYTSSESGRREVFIRPFSGPVRKWPVSTGGGASPRWRRDERELFFVNGTRLMAAPVSTAGATVAVGAPQLLFEDSALSWSGADLFRYDVTADGQHFLALKPDPREERPLQLVVIPQFVREMHARLAAPR